MQQHHFQLLELLEAMGVEAGSIGSVENLYRITQFIKQFKTATEESERDLMAAMRAAEGGAGRGSGSDDGDEDGSGGGADGDPTATLDDKMVVL